MDQSLKDLAPEIADAVRAALENVLRSQAFTRSERHSRFLRFICEATLNGDGPKLNEYLIAHTVFDRGAEYSSGEDSVVRRQAYSLRQKLKDYHAEEGKDSAVWIELPTGRYVPTFHVRETLGAETTGYVADQSPLPPEPEEITLAPPAVVAQEHRLRPHWKWAAAGAACILLVAGGYAVGTRQATRGPELDAAFHHIWGPWLSYSAEGAIICYSNALTAGIRQTELPFPTNNPTRGIGINEPEAQDIRKDYPQLPAGGFFYLNPTLSHAKMGEALGAVPLTVMFAKAGVPVRAVQSRYMNWQDFRLQNLILLGHSEANRWLDPILSNLPFHLAKTDPEKPRRIVNPNFRTGERAEYFPDYSKGRNPAVEDYALISMPGGIDGRHGLALINGVNTEGTEMALEYLTDAESLRGLESALRNESPGHTGTWHFQAILHSPLQGGVSTRVELAAVRVLP
ncbi:MAG: hypothetical protein EBY17_22995 [Acidobacteriia bacterium]|nr:hypothetical protein [Terriglobia bacterium]